MIFWNRRDDRRVAALRRWLPPLLLSGFVGILAAGGWASAVYSRSDAVALPAPSLDEPHHAQTGKETVVLAGGCFWGVQSVF